MLSGELQKTETEKFKKFVRRNRAKDLEKGKKGPPPASPSSHHHQIDKLIDRHRRKPLAIKADLAQRAPLFLGKHARDISLEFLNQHRYTLLAALAVAERIIDLRQRGLGAVLEVHLDRGGIGALSG